MAIQSHTRLTLPAISIMRNPNKYSLYDSFFGLSLLLCKAKTPAPVVNERNSGVNWIITLMIAAAINTGGLMKKNLEGGIAMTQVGYRDREENDEPSGC
ncbi:hypothetical protein Dsin_002875 [Dipteronia sinensis]|uniref:Uncharacterized protein n=1 Tax=Dipteronia sinensis TaxID=43782 RepID=A0AAE0EK35_9ROSI|nr:hypothetical protein Dsin_002875 [Dipteronia sinensis]